MLGSASANNMRPSIDNAETLVQAGKTVEQVIMRDQNYPDLATLLSGHTSDMYIQPLINSTEELLKTNTIYTPQILLDELAENAQCRCFTGVLPEIGRAWMSIDHKLYIWNYNNPSEIYEYHDQDQIIINVGLIKPKAGIFGDDITHLLVFSTPLQVIILALSVKATELKMYATEMSVPTDDVQMKIIKGTEDGRIFMIGNNGKPYEYKYNHPDRWALQKFHLECKFTDTSINYFAVFGRRRKIDVPHIKSLAIDDERKLLYLLTDTSIEVIDIGNLNNDYKSIYKNTTIIETATQLCRQNNRNYNADAFTLESAHVISTAESKKIHLVAMTTAGLRLYFSTYKDAFRQTLGVDNSNMRSTTLEIGHVRLPPNEAQQTLSGLSNASFRHTFYDCGVCLSVKSLDEDVDSIYCSSVAPSNVVPPQQPVYSNMAAFNQPRNVYIETMSVVKTTEKTWMITETRTEMKGKRHMKEISQQLSDAPRQFLALTSKSIVFYNKLRPVDILLRMIQKPGRTQQEEQKEYSAFFERYGRTESCAMCLSIICNTDNPDIVKKTANLFFEFGGSPTSANALQTPGNHLGQVVGQTGITFSGKHDGFVLYLARLLTPIWKLKIFENCNPANPKANILCTKTQALLCEVRSNLEDLKRFMDLNPQFHDSAKISDPRFQAADRSKLELDLAEQKSVRELYLLLAQAIDAVYFIEFLLDSRVNTILSLDRFNLDYLRQLFDLDMSLMIITTQGRELASELVIITIGEYGSNHTHASFNIVSHQLEKSCSNFFGPKDNLFFKGMEHVKLAVKIESEYDRITNIKQSLEYFKKAADKISVAKLKAICQFYVQFSYHVGIIELALERAHQVDPQNQALSAYETGHSSDEAKNALLAARMETYNFALGALSDALELRSQPLPPNRIPIQDPAVYQRNVIDTAIRSRDELFHYRLYGWFMENGLKEELLKFETPYLVSYFEKYVPDEQSSLGFLWEYYRNREHYANSAACLVRLARSNSPTLKLASRMKYLVMARANAQSEKDVSPALAEFNVNLAEMIRNCTLQQRVQDILRSAEGVEAQVAADHLDRELLSGKQLWEQCGKKFHFLHDLFV